MDKIPKLCMYRYIKQRCVSLSDFLSENMQRLMNEEMYAVVPLPTCPHLTEVQAIPDSGIDANTPCSDCQSPRENWICLVCYGVSIIF